jgi:hypothetical protein
MRKTDTTRPFQPTITLTECLTNPHVFGSVFGAPSFWTWRVVGKLIDNIPLVEPREIELYEQCTGRPYVYQTTPREVQMRRFIVLAGRRAGKDRFFSAVAVWRAALCTDWRQYLSPGEEAVCILLGKDRKQAAILRKYCHGLLQVPALAREVLRETKDVVEFRNGSKLEIASNDPGLVRGRSAIAVLGSEVSVWQTDENSPMNDEEVVTGAQNSLAMCPDGGLLLMWSTVYLYRKYRELFGNDQANDVCWFAPTKVMNPILPQSVIDGALADDPHKAAADFNNVWRSIALRSPASKR